MKGFFSQLRAKRRIARHTLASVRHESKLKVAVVASSAVVLWGGLFSLALWALGLLRSFGGELLGGGRVSLGDLVMARLLALFALALFVMLVFSNVLIVFSTLYRSREMPFLVQSPLAIPELFLGRFVECVSFSSWASAYLGSALLLAYGLESGAPWPFYLALPAFFFPFVVLPAALGAIVCMLLIRYFAGLERRHVLVVGLVLGGLVLGFFRGELSAPNPGGGATLQALVQAVGRTQSPFLPSSWLAEGISSTARGDFGEAAFYWLLLVANALLVVRLAVAAAEAWFYEGWSALWSAAAGRSGGGMAGGVSAGRVSAGVWRWLGRLLRPLPAPIRALVTKDVKLFWRDPAQWSQFVLFFGIMAIYVANLDNARGVASQPAWRGWAALLNSSASMLILATLTTRFVFPLVSLEGRRFWMLGLAPITLRRIVWQKFWLSFSTASLFTVGLALLSARALDLEPSLFLLSTLSIACTTLALSGLAVGLGSLYPNFREDNPARIVSGLGGTLNFLLSLLYILLVTAGQALVFQWHQLESHLAPGAFPWVLAAVLGWIGGWTLIAWLLPMRLGLRHLVDIEL